MPTPATTGLLGVVPPRSPECAALITEIAERVDLRVGEIAERLIDRVVIEMPELQGDDELREQLVAAAAGSVSLITAMTRSWTDPHVVPPPHEALIWARGLVARGLSIDILLRVYRNGQSGYHDVWHQELVASGRDPAVVLEALHACSAFFFTWVEAISTPLVEAYEEERDRRMRGAEAVRLETTQAILAGEQLDPTRASARLGYELGRTHVAFVAWVDEDAEGGDAALEEAVHAIRETLGTEERPLLVQAQPRTVTGWLARAVLSPESADALREALRGGPVRMAIGAPGHGVPGFRLSHDQAQRARRVARLLRRAAPVTSYADVAITDLLTRDVAAARRVARATLGPLAGNDDASRRLLATLRVFLEEGQSFARAGRRLGIHQNTVAYRVRRAIELTGQEGPGSQALHAAVALAPLLDDEAPADPPA
jgi:hypothetical protein